MKINQEFDKDNLMLSIEVQSNLLKKYYPNLVGLLSKEQTVPEGYSISQVAPGVAKILIPITTIDREREAFGFDAGSVFEVINKFANAALKYELEHTEFIPLSGYPVSNLQEDIKVSVRNKRNLCVLKEYSEYLRMEAEKKFQFTQVILDYGTQDWADAVLDVIDGRLDVLTERLSPRLKLTDWS